MINKCGKTQSAYCSELVIFFKAQQQARKFLKIKAKIKLLLKYSTCYLSQIIHDPEN